MNNSTIKIFQQQLYNLINNCGLPVGTAYFVLKDATNELEKTFNECVYKESQDNNNETSEVQTIEMPEPQEHVYEQMEETENEGTNANASEHSGSTNDN